MRRSGVLLLYVDQHAVHADSLPRLAEDQRFLRSKSACDVILSWIAVKPRW